MVKVKEVNRILLQVDKALVIKQKRRKLLDDHLARMKGEKGDKGDKGEIGLTGRGGIKGKQGQQGFEGKQGVKGEIGFSSDIPGPKGQTGKQGKTGKKGTDGKHGKDGSPDTGSKIVEKVNLLDIRPGLQIHWKHISGLKELIEDLTSRIMTADVNARNALALGGMGTPLSQTFIGDGSTTAFTLTKDIGGEGKALWVYYNGQWLVPTTHFTISQRKIINTTFTPEDGTDVDVLYLPAE